MIQTLLEIIRLKKRLLVFMGILLVVTIGFSLFVVNNQASAIADAQIRWNELRKSVVLAGKQDVAVSYRKGKGDVEAINARIPLKRDFPRVLGDVLDAAAANGTVIGNLSYKPQVIKDENLLAYGVTMAVGGSYASVKSFLADVLKNRELVVVEGFTLTNNDLYEEFVTIELRLSVYLRENA